MNVAICSTLVGDLLEVRDLVKIYLPTRGTSTNMELKTSRLSFNLAREGEVRWFRAVAYIAVLKQT